MQIKIYRKIERIILQMEKSKRMKIKVKKTQREFRLLTFNPYDAKTAPEEDARAGAGVARRDARRFVVQMFGINEKGETATIYVSGFRPFFYIKVESSWYGDQGKLLSFKSQIVKEIGDYYQDSITSIKYVSKKKLYGFDGGTKHTFIELRFQSESAMRKVKNLWYTSGISPTGEYTRILKPTGYMSREDSIQTYRVRGANPPSAENVSYQKYQSVWVDRITDKQSVESTEKK